MKDDKNQKTQNTTAGVENDRVHIMVPLAALFEAGVPRSGVSARV
jgi:hypothetical protein